MKNKWKTIAIIFIILFGLLMIYNIWAINYYFAEEDKTTECYYDICEEYYDAYYVDDVCYCYDEEYNLEKTDYMKKGN